MEVDVHTLGTVRIENIGCNTGPVVEEGLSVVAVRIVHNALADEDGVDWDILEEVSVSVVAAAVAVAAASAGASDVAAEMTLAVVEEVLVVVLNEGHSLVVDRVAQEGLYQLVEACPPAVMVG